MSTIHRWIAVSPWQLQQCTSCSYCPNQRVVWACGERPFPGGPAPPKWGTQDSTEKGCVSAEGAGLHRNLQEGTIVHSLKEAATRDWCRA